MEKKRDYRFDNIKFILIFAVVFGHLLEITPGYGSSSILYKILYSFHMPAFIFVTGYFARLTKEKFYLRLVWSYVLFQSLYLIFDHYILYQKPLEEFAWQLTTPYWLMWYLLAIIFYHLLIPVLTDERKWVRVLIWIGSLLLSLMAGCDANIGYFLSLSRIFTFLPYFVLGYYWGHYPKPLLVKVENKWWLKPLAWLAAAGSIYVIISHENIVANMLYGSYSYQAIAYTGYNWQMRLTLFLVGLGWIFFFLYGIPFAKYKWYVISSIGKNTLSIFLLHGFLVRYMAVTGLFNQPTVTVGTAIALTAAFLLLFGNIITAKLVQWFGTGYLLQQLAVKINGK